MDILTRDVTFSFGNEARPAYLALPEGSGPFPGIVVIHEIYGLNDNIRDIARRFATQGYAALAVDLFSGRNRMVCMFRYMSANLRGKDDHSGIQELRAALSFLSEQQGVDAGRLGAIGFCMGGGFAVAWAFKDARLQVIAPFYGSNPRNLEEVAKRSCPVVGSYPGKDFTAASGQALKEALDKAGIDNDIKIYPEAGHSFFNDDGRAFNPEAAADAWERTLKFFGERLGAAASH